MKKFFLILLVLVTLCSCANNKKQETSSEEKYKYLVETLTNYSGFSSGSSYYDINADMSKIEDGYRYYVTLDNPRLSMYEVSILAIEKDSDYKNTMAASSGIFDSRCSLIPNQSKVEEGFVKGIVISGTTSVPDATLLVYVNFYNRDYSKEYTEYIQMEISYGE